MKTIKYLLMASAAFLMMTGCYEDKGSYNTGSWTSIVSVEGVEIPGSSTAYNMDLQEEELLTINPKITYKEGVDESKVTYHWVFGSDTIGEGKNLDWQVVRTEQMEFGSDGYAYFWLAINNTATGEIWRYFLRGASDVMLKFRIVSTATPRIGVMVYQKPDNTLEWASVKGQDPAAPQNFTTVLTDLYTHYNTTRTLSGEFVSMSNRQGKMVIYTNTAPDYGVLITTSQSDSYYPLGFYRGTVADEIFQGAPDGNVVSQSVVSDMGEELVNNSLYIGRGASSGSSYIAVLPHSTPTQAGVAQTMGANPYSNLHFSIQLTTSGELYYYKYDDSYGYRRTALPDESGATLTADRIIGVFHQPTFVEKQIKMFVVARTGSVYTLYSYTMEPMASGNDVITYTGKKDVTAWAGGLTDETTWFTNAIEVPLNYLYIVKGKDVWRTSYESLADPVVVRSFPDEITYATVATGYLIQSSSDEYYTAIFTYNETSQTSKMYVVDAQSSELADFSEVETAIPGKVLQYAPIVD